MRMPANFARGTFLVAGLAAAAWVVFAVALGWGDLAGAVARVGAGPLLAACGLSLANYGLRFLRWEAFLGQVGVRLGRRPSLALYFASYVMVITPGKLGEAFKAVLMRDRWSVPLAKGLPVVLAERIYDFLAVLALAVAGLAFWEGPGHGIGAFVAAGCGFALLLVLVRHEGLHRLLVGRAAASRHLGGHTLALDAALAATRTLLSPGRGAAHLALSVVAWAGECGGMWILARALAPAVSFTDALFIYAAATLAGSLSFLPGGLGGTEAVLILLLSSLGTPGPAAAAVAFLTRAATLWLAVLVGLGVFLALRSDVTGEAAASPAPDPGGS